MKRLLFILVIIPFIFSCQTKQRDQEQWNKDFEIALVEAQNESASEDTIFLNFRFGMSEKEVMNHFNSLLKEKKVYLKDNKYTYDFHTSQITLETRFEAEYFNSKLYKFILIFNGDNTMDGSLNMFQALNTFKEKALSDGYRLYIYENLLGETEYYYIKKNIVIQFSNIGSTAKMIYTNQPVIELINQEKKKQEKSTISDF